MRRKIICPNKYFESKKPVGERKSHEIRHKDLYKHNYPFGRRSRPVKTYKKTIGFCTTCHFKTYYKKEDCD